MNTAKLFKSGNSQAVRLPKAYNFEGREVYVNKVGRTVVLIPKDDPSTSKKEGWADGDTITIKVDGFTTVPSFAAFSGTKKIDLFLPSLDVKLTTWGKIKALFK